jgi:hypothetical protein
MTMSTTTKYSAAILVLVLDAFGFGCASDVAPDGARVLDLDSKSDVALSLDLEAIDLFHVNCGFETCRFRLFLEGDIAGELWVVAGTDAEMRTHRERVLSGADPSVGADATEPQAVVVAGGVGSTSIQVPNGNHFGIAYQTGAGASPELDATLRLVPDLDAATELPQTDVGEYGVSSVMEEGTHRWRVGVTDVLGFFDPTVSVTLVAESRDQSLAVSYQCTSDGTTIDLGRATVDFGASFALHTQEFAPDCPTFDDGGAVYIEASGTPSSDLFDVYSLTVVVGES